MLNIISYNTTSLVSRQKRAEVNHVIDNQCANIILLQETHLKNNHSLFLSGMKVVRTDDGVGTAIGVKCNIKYEKVTLNLECINYTAVSVKRKEGTVLVISIYVPCGIGGGRLWKDLQMIKVAAEQYEETVLGGDWNAHHAQWLSGGQENPAGRTIMRFLNDNAVMEILSTATHTFRGRTTLDFFIVTRGVIRNGYEIEVGPAQPDHSPVILKLDGSGLLNVEKKKVYVYKGTD